MCFDEEKLHRFAVGVLKFDRSWFQDKDKRRPHYDLTTEHARDRAVASGAVPVGAGQMVNMFVPDDYCELEDLGKPKMKEGGLFAQIPEPQEVQVLGGYELLEVKLKDSKGKEWRIQIPYRIVTEKGDATDGEEDREEG
jgi:hypothetical protein